MSATNYNIRIDRELRDRAFAVFESYGLAPAQAIKLFLNQVADTRTVPLSFSYKTNVPNARTQAAMQEIIEDRTGRHLKRYDSAEEMMQDILESAE